MNYKLKILIYHILRLDYIYDTLLIESEFNLTLPAWTDQVFSVKSMERFHV